MKRATKSGGPYTIVASPAAATYVDSTVANGTVYYYVVSALNAGGQSGNSTEVSAAPVAPSAPPPVPTNLQATAGNAQISLTWTASSGATSYHVKRATISGGPYAQIAAPTTASYTDSQLVNGTNYYYVVTAVNSAGESANSTPASTAPSPPSPTTFGTWTDVTPSGADLTSALPCGNFGADTVQMDPANPSNIYTEINCQGIWKSVDYGVTWTGPINTGANGATAGDCSGGITISAHSIASVPTIYESCIRGAGTGFWKSVDGGVNWTSYVVAPTTRQDYFPPVVDPYDENHLVMTAHEFDSVVESVDGGQTWTAVSLDNGMLQNGGTGYVFFINTGSASTTSGTWLWIGQQSGGLYGTWRTTNGGSSWVQVDKSEHPAGSTQIYQPDSSGVVYMAGAYSALGFGVLRSSDYGQTWAHVGMSTNETVVVGTSKNVYSMFGFPIGIGGVADPVFEVASQPGTGTWVPPGTPAGLTQGSAQIAVMNDGTHNILVGAMWNSGVWRYIEP
ncbi:MAG: fibronectin type III domain-containing protein [Steroidobacteraceae bacterium]